MSSAGERASVAFEALRVRSGITLALPGAINVASVGMQWRTEPSVDSSGGAHREQFGFLLPRAAS